MHGAKVTIVDNAPYGSAGETRRAFMEWAVREFSTCAPRGMSRQSLRGLRRISSRARAARCRRRPTFRTDATASGSPRRCSCSTSSTRFWIGDPRAPASPATRHRDQESGLRFGCHSRIRFHRALVDSRVIALGAGGRGIAFAGARGSSVWRRDPPSTAPRPARPDRSVASGSGIGFNGTGQLGDLLGGGGT